MTPDEQRELAELSHATIILNSIELVQVIKFEPDELATYTAAVEAKERERCAVIADNQPVGNSLAGRIRRLK